MSHSAAPAPDQILQIGLGFWASKTLLKRRRNGGLHRARQTPGGPSTLLPAASACIRDPHTTFLMRSSRSAFWNATTVSYSNTPSTDLFLDKHKPSYIGGILEMANKRLYGHWGKLTIALRTGERQSEEPREENVFAALYADPARLKGFLRAMTGVSRGANIAIASQFPWAKYKTAADCGTAQGDLIVQVALKNPHLTGTGFDLARSRAHL